MILKKIKRSALLAMWNVLNQQQANDVPSGYKEFEYAAGRNLDLLKRLVERLNTTISRRAEGHQEYDKALDAITQKYAVKNEKGSPMRARPGMVAGPGVYFFRGFMIDDPDTLEEKVRELEEREDMRGYVEAQRKLSEEAEAFLDGEDTDVQVYAIKYGSIPEGAFSRRHFQALFPLIVELPAEGESAADIGDAQKKDKNPTKKQEKEQQELEDRSAE